MRVATIVVTGPESTGKSTLCEQLSKYYHSQWIAEYAREYIESKDFKYDYADVEHIAAYQHQHLQKTLKEIELNITQYDKEIYPLFVDTHLILTKVWFEKVYNKEPEWLQKAITATEIEHYLLCEPDLEWRYDPVRENPHLRKELYERYRELIEQEGNTYSEINGQGETRLQNAIKEIDKIINKKKIIL